MRTILFMCAFVLTVFVFSCGDDTSTDKSSGDSTAIRQVTDDTIPKDTTTVPPPAYDCNAMIAQYQALDNEGKQATQSMQFDMSTLTRFISAHNLPPDATWFVKYAAYDEANARLYMEQYYRNDPGVGINEIINKPTVVLILRVGSTDYCYPIGKVCPPPPDCDL